MKQIHSKALSFVLIFIDIYIESGRWEKKIGKLNQPPSGDYADFI